MSMCEYITYTYVYETIGCMTLYYIAFNYLSGRITLTLVFITGGRGVVLPTERLQSVLHRAARPPPAAVPASHRQEQHGRATR